MVAGFDGTVCVWAKETRLGAILSLDREVIPKKKEPSAWRVMKLEDLKQVPAAQGMRQMLGQYHLR